MRIGITGQAGFIGTHLARYVVERVDTELIQFEDVFFSDPLKLRSFVKKCDVLVHLAAASRMSSEDALYELNIRLVQQLIDAMEAEGVRPLVMFSSSTHETRDTAYGRAKKEGCARFEKWARCSGASFIGFVFPNVYGPGARVHYASFIANFAWELQHGEEPKVQVDSLIKLIYVKNLCRFIGDGFSYHGIGHVPVPEDMEVKVSDVLSIFRLFSAGVNASCIDGNSNLYNLYTTYSSYKSIRL